MRKLVSLFERYDLSLTAFDVKGEAFEYFLGDTFTGGLGEYFTPRNVVEFLVDALDPKIGDKIIDPFCGTGGFLIFVFELVGEKIRLQEFSEDEKKRWKYELSNRCLYGTDWKERTSQACRMNMMVHGDGSAGIFKHHGLVNIPGVVEDGLFDICVTNPPFGSFENDVEILSKYELGAGRNTQSRAILALERLVKLAKPMRYIGIIIIDGILNNETSSYVRNYIKKNTWIKAIISLSKETFEGYGSRAKTSILILQKKQIPDEGEQKQVFMSIAQNTGYAPNGKQIPGNELPEILMDYNLFVKGEDLRYHDNSWISELGDRLDAEYYWKRSFPTKSEHDTNDIEMRISTSLHSINDEYSKLKKELEIIEKATDYEVIKISDILEEIKVKEKVHPNKIYKLLGVRWWGGGAFMRETKLGKDIKAKTLHKVSSGCLIYNRLFAFRGSFAILEDEHDGCYVSGEFPLFTIKDDINYTEKILKYVVHCINSPHYLGIVDSLSTGSTKTSRNRFNQKIFLDFNINIPTGNKTIIDIVTLLDRVDELKNKQQKLLDDLKIYGEHISRLIPLPYVNEDEY